MNILDYIFPDLLDRNDPYLFYLGEDYNNYDFTSPNVNCLPTKPICEYIKQGTVKLPVYIAVIKELLKLQSEKKEKEKYCIVIFVESKYYATIQNLIKTNEINIINTRILKKK